MRSFWGFEYLNPILVYLLARVVQYHSTLEKMSWDNSQLDQSKIPETELRFFQLNWDFTLATLVALWQNCFKIWSKNYQAFLFSYAIDVWFNMSISHTLIGKSKHMDFSMILMYLNMILLNSEAKVSFDFWTNFTYFGQSV